MPNYSLQVYLLMAYKKSDSMTAEDIQLVTAEMMTTIIVDYDEKLQKSRCSTILVAAENSTRTSTFIM